MGVLADQVEREERVPVRGQVLYVEQVGLDRWWLDSSGPTYIVPRSHDIVVGGTEEEGDWSRTPRPETAREILTRAVLAAGTSDGPVAAEAALTARVFGARVERVDDVVHCYGHGGAGVTLSWGTADEVALLVVG